MSERWIPTREQEPDHPLLLPLLANDRELAKQAPVAWRWLENLTEPGSKVLLDAWAEAIFDAASLEELLGRE